MADRRIPPRPLPDPDGPDLKRAAPEAAPLVERKAPLARPDPFDRFDHPELPEHLERLERARRGGAASERDPEPEPEPEATRDPDPEATRDPDPDPEVTATRDPDPDPDPEVTATATVEPGPATESDPPPPALPEGARIWENRSDEADSPYQHMEGPDIGYVDGIWFAIEDDGTLVRFHEGRYLDLGSGSDPSTEALGWESTVGTALFGQGPPQAFGLRLDGETGDFVTADGSKVDPDALVLLRAGDGSAVWFDADRGTWSAVATPGVPLDDPPDGPFETLNSGLGTTPPLDELEPGESLGFDPSTLRYHEGPDGPIVGFHATTADEIRVWENRSDEAGNWYSDMAGPDVAYLDGVWYYVDDGGHYVPFHEGPVLDFSEVSAPLGEAVQFESMTGTPLEGQGVIPSDLGLRLDGETGELVDATGKPVDLESYDPAATDFGSGSSEPPPDLPPDVPPGSPADTDDGTSADAGVSEQAWVADPAEPDGDDDAGWFAPDGSHQIVDFADTDDGAGEEPDGAGGDEPAG